MRRLLLLAALTISASAQWTIQTPATTADLRGIDNVGKGIAWASGTGGTVLRTEDNGYLWQRCTTPPNADHLDFRGIQAFDANTAIVMSSGKGDLSRLYKTTDGCQTWKLLFTNPDKEGFWDSITFIAPEEGFLLGDPVGGRFYSRQSTDGGKSWQRFASDNALRASSAKAGIFAASNSSIVVSDPSNVLFAIANQESGPVIFKAGFGSVPCNGASPHCHKDYAWWEQTKIPIARNGESSGVFALARDNQQLNASNVFVAVGGDYLKPNDSSGSAAYTANSGSDWHPAITPPHGYRSAVAYDAPTKTWITVGPNGTDISTNDGRNWHPLKPSATDTPDADRNWNALSLPFVVGPHGRIGILNPTALKP